MTKKLNKTSDIDNELANVDEINASQHFVADNEIVDSDVDNLDFDTQEIEQSLDADEVEQSLDVDSDEANQSLDSDETVQPLDSYALEAVQYLEADGDFELGNADSEYDLEKVKLHYDKNGWVCDVFPLFISLEDSVGYIEITRAELDKVWEVSEYRAWKIVDSKITQEKYEKYYSAENYSIQTDEQNIGDLNEEEI